MCLCVFSRARACTRECANATERRGKSGRWMQRQRGHTRERERGRDREAVRTCLRERGCLSYLEAEGAAAAAVEAVVVVAAEAAEEAVERSSCVCARGYVCKYASSACTHTHTLTRTRTHAHTHTHTCHTGIVESHLI